VASGQAGTLCPCCPGRPRTTAASDTLDRVPVETPTIERRSPVGSVIKKRRKRMAKKKHRKLLKKTRVQRRNKK
jgi:hypothetical protein